MTKLHQFFAGVVMLASFTVLPVSQAADVDVNANAQKARVMFDKAIALIEKEGIFKALYEFNTNKKDFVDGSNHIMVVTEDGVVFAYSIDPGLVGVNLSTVKSEAPGSSTEYSFQDALADMEKAGDNITEIKWKWMNPVTNELQLKQAYVKRIYDPNANFRVIFYVGAAYFAPLDGK